MIDKEKLTDAEAHAVALALFAMRTNHQDTLAIVPASIREATIQLSIEMSEHCALERPDPTTLP